MLLNPIAASIKLADSSSVVVFYDMAALTDCSHVMLENTLALRSRWEHFQTADLMDETILQKSIAVKPCNASPKCIHVHHTCAEGLHTVSSH